MQTALKKIRCTFMIEPEVLDKLRSIKQRTGLSESEQIRQGIRWWLESREWPEPAPTLRPRVAAAALPAARLARRAARRHPRR